MMQFLFSARKASDEVKILGHEDAASRFWQTWFTNKLGSTRVCEETPGDVAVMTYSAGTCLHEQFSEIKIVQN
jgi:hypothetical protein